MKARYACYCHGCHLQRRSLALRREHGDVNCAAVTHRLSVPLYHFILLEQYCRWIGTKTSSA